jgi:hypothetical protein
MKDRIVYVLHITPPTNDPAPIVRLRRCLKAILRSFGMRCIRVSEQKPGEEVLPEEGTPPATP